MGKPNRKGRCEAERNARKKRTHIFAHKREIPIQVIYHAVEECPDCGRHLCGGWVRDRRQVIEILDAPVFDHVFVARRCGVCGKRHIPKLDWNQ